VAKRPELGQIGRAVARPSSVIWAGVVAVVLALLLDSAGLAVIIASFIVPVAILIDLSHRDVFEQEPWQWLVTAGAFGAVSGLFVSLLTILALKQFESEIDPARQCCGLFASRVNLEVPNAGPLSILLVGLLLPIVAELLKLSGPLFLRQQATFRNEVMDGAILGAASGGGYAVATAIVYFWPLLQNDPPPGSVANWTAALIGVLVVRPAISCATTGLLCTGIWHRLLGRGRLVFVVGAAPALAGAVTSALVGLAVAGRSSVAELVLQLAVLAGLALAAQFAIRGALEEDRRARALREQWIRCPRCQQMTPPGRFCAQCGSPLVAPALVATAGAEPAPASADSSLEGGEQATAGSSDADSGIEDWPASPR
jgi:RsiW-degrading membrane proteinase PrsW (M82 family)